MLRFKNEKEFRNSGVLNTRKASTIHKDNLGNESIDTAYKQAVEAICMLKGINGDMLHSGPVGFRIEFPDSQADTDNLSKGVHDALQGIAYKNDKQIITQRSHKGEDVFAGLI